MIRKAQQVLSEARYFVELEKLIPKLDTSLPARAIAEQAAQLFKLADPKSVKRFNAVAPCSLAEHNNSTVRAVVARLSRGSALREALKDSSKNVRAAALVRMNEVGETQPDSAPLADLSDEYYKSIAQRLVNDFPDRSGDWINQAIANTVRSYRSTSGVQLDGKKLKSAVKERLAELQDTDGVHSCLEEAISVLDEMSEEDTCEIDDSCVESARERSDDYTIESEMLPKLTRQRMMSEHDSVVTDGPKRIIFEKKIGYRERKITERITNNIAAKLRGTARVSWMIETPTSAVIIYKS